MSSRTMKSKQLVAGAARPLRPSAMKAIQSLMQQRAREGANVEPDVRAADDDWPTAAVILANHLVQDLQSLMLHTEAVRLMKQQPQLVQKALDTLERWRNAGPSHSQSLWDQWRLILEKRNWRRALSTSQRSTQLRQASPLATLLPPEVRERVLEEVRLLKKRKSED